MQRIDETAITEPPSFEELFAEEDADIRRIFDNAFPEEATTAQLADADRLVAVADELLLALDRSDDAPADVDGLPSRMFFRAEADDLELDDSPAPPAVRDAQGTPPPFSRPSGSALATAKRPSTRDLEVTRPSYVMPVESLQAQHSSAKHLEVTRPAYVAPVRAPSGPPTEPAAKSKSELSIVDRLQPTAREAEVVSAPFRRPTFGEVESTSHRFVRPAASDLGAAAAEPAVQVDPSAFAGMVNLEADGKATAHGHAAGSEPIWQPPKVADAKSTAHGHISADAPIWQPPTLHLVAPASTEAAVAEQPAADSAPTRIGEVITVFGCRGGCGATTIAVNLAGSLAAEGNEVCIVDLDVQLGDVLVALDLDVGAASLVNIAREAHSLDPDALKRRLVRHDSGVYVLAQGGRLEEIDETLPSKIAPLLAMLARHFDTVIIDGINDFSELALSAIDASNMVALVLPQDVLAVRRARRVIDICRQLEVPEHKIKPIVNRYRKRSSIDRRNIAAGLKIEVAATIVDDETTTSRSQDAGQLLHTFARRKQVTRDVAALALLTAPRTSDIARADTELPDAGEQP